ncbi:MAG: hypothetical protein ACO3CN_05930 [Candidatus Nanopelagicales bacterium]
MSDDVWNVIAKHLAEYEIPFSNEVRKAIEKSCDIVSFNGGAFISYGNEFDLFVVPEKRGKWNIKHEIKKYLSDMKQKHGTLLVRINEKNTRSLRLARFFGFIETGREDGDVIRLELK